MNDAPQQPLESEEAAPASAQSIRAGSASAERWMRLLPLGACVAPAECACCGGLARASVKVRGSRDRAEVLVNYCEECLLHSHRDGTRVLAVSLASLLMALTVAAAFPLLTQSSSLLWHTLLVLLAASLPILGGVVPRPPPSVGHAAWGAAVVGSRRSVLFARPSYAASFAAKNVHARWLTSAAPARFSAWMLAGPVLGIALVALVRLLYFPTLRVLNLNEQAFVIAIDGQARGLVEPTSVESPSAGIELELAAGPHRLEARARSGAVLFAAAATLTPGRAHLYAPGNDEYCFWLETAGYGRSITLPDRQPLVAESRFFTLPSRLDGWFTPLASKAKNDGALSGGFVSVLRQARCVEAPPGAIEPASN